MQVTTLFLISVLSWKRSLSTDPLQPFTLRLTEVMKSLPEGATQEDKANAFVEAMRGEIDSLMPNPAVLPGMEEISNSKYTCLTQGESPLTIQWEQIRRPTIISVMNEEKKIDISLKFQLQLPFMKYKMCSEVLTAAGKFLDIETRFKKAVAELTMEVPDFSDDSWLDECIIIVKNFKVHLKDPQSNLLSRHPLKRMIDSMATEYVQQNLEETMNVLREGVVKTMSGKLKFSKDPVCKSKELETLADSYKREYTNNYKTFCGS